MICGIITLIFGILSIIMFTQPVIGVYGENSEGDLSSIDSKASLFDFITFDKGQPIYHTVASVFLILSLVFAGIMLLLTLVNLIARAANNKAFIGAKVSALMFFLCMLVAVVMVGVYCINDLPLIGKEGWKLFKEMGIYITVGWGMLVAFGASFICLIFAPRKKK